MDALEVRLARLVWNHLVKFGYDIDAIPYKGWVEMDFRKALEEDPILISKDAVIQAVDDFRETDIEDDDELDAYEKVCHYMEGIHDAYESMEALIGPECL